MWGSWGETLPFWVRADTQTGGVGRRGRAWLSPPGNLYASLVTDRLGTHDAREAAAAYGFAVSLGVRDACVGAGAAPGRLAVKWPNDVILDGAKLAGLLIDRVDRGDGRVPDPALIVGIGVNLAIAPEVPDYAAAALAQACAPPAPRVFLDVLDAAIARRMAQGFGALKADWLGAAVGIGGPVAVRLPGGTEWRGTALGLDDHGGLRVEVGGTVRTANAGDVFFGAEAG